MSASVVPFPTILLAAIVLLGFFQLLVVLAALLHLKRTRIERYEVNQSIQQMLQRLEVLNLRDRGEFVHLYEGMVESLVNRLPVMVSTRAGDAIFEIEKRVLAQLALIDPRLTSSAQTVDDLIRSMEKLEDTVITVVASSVRDALLDSKEGIARQFPIDETGSPRQNKGIFSSEERRNRVSDAG